MLNERAQHLLKVLIERYIVDGQPVGSRTLSRLSGIDLSPASVRNVMADLEALGFIASPHASAGRVPTTRGYRYFVDSLLTTDNYLVSKLYKQLADQLHPDDPQRLVNTASQLLSELSHFAGVVMTPKRKNLTIRHIEFLRMTDRRVLLILVSTDGSVQNRFLEVERAYSTEELTQAANFLNHHYVGCTFLAMRSRLQAELRQIHSDLTTQMAAALSSSEDDLGKEEDLVLSGELNLINVNDLAADISHLRRLFTVFEQKTALMRLLDLSQRAPGVQIFIGGESGLLPIDACSVITSSYQIDGEVVGTLGVIGPMRMAYERMIPIVDITAKMLSSALSTN